MIDFTYNPIIPADYKSQRERPSLRSLSLRPVLFVCRRVRTTKAAQPKTGPTYYKVSPAIFLLILFYCPQNCNIALSYYGVHSLDVFA